MSDHTRPGTWTIKNINDGPVDPGMFVTSPERDIEEFYLLPDEVYANLRADLRESDDPHTVAVLQSAEMLLGLGQGHIQVVRFMARQIDRINIIDES